MPVVIRRLFGVGKLPAELRAEAHAEGILYFADYVPVTRRFHGVIPGLRSPSSLASYVGSLVFTKQRALATFSSLPRLAGRAVDVPWDATQSGPAKVEISARGLQVDLDLDAINPELAGHLSLRYKAAVPGDVLSGLPHRSFSFEVPAEYVFRAVGVPYRP